LIVAGDTRPPALDAATPMLCGYYLNKQHWNTITVEGSVADATATTLIGDSYDLVVAGLSRSERERLAQSDDR
jgi:predicted DNA-binding protein (MmcQ/YjbR family)